MDSIRDAMQKLIDVGLITEKHVKEYLGFDMSTPPEEAKKTCDILHTLIFVGSDTYYEEEGFEDPWRCTAHSTWLSYVTHLKREFMIETWEEMLKYTIGAVQLLKHLHEAGTSNKTLSLLRELLNATTIQQLPEPALSAASTISSQACQKDQSEESLSEQESS
jgi:hypothetical protein